MSRELVLQRQLRALATLEEAIGALRALSAQHFRAARAPLPAARAYREEVGRFLAALEHPTAPEDASGQVHAPTGIVLVASDLGLVGDYTARLVDEAVALRAERGPGPLVCLGQRALAPLAKAGITPTNTEAAPASAAGLSGRLLPLVDALLGLRQRGELGALWLVAARFQGAGTYAPARVPVLPVAPEPGTARLPVSPYGTSAALRAVVVREFLYAALYETLLEALASEHGKRLVTAESARSWLRERIDATNRRVAAIRREAATQEVLEVVTASRAARRQAARP